MENVLVSVSFSYQCFAFWRLDGHGMGKGYHRSSSSFTNGDGESAAHTQDDQPRHLTRSLTDTQHSTRQLSHPTTSEELGFPCDPNESLVIRLVALRSIHHDPHDLCLMSTYLVIPLRASSHLLFSVTNQQCFFSWNLYTTSQHSFRSSADWLRIHNPQTIINAAFLFHPLVF